MAQKIKEVNGFKVGEWVEIGWMRVAHRIIAFNTTKTQAHVRNRLDSMHWIDISELEKKSDEPKFIKGNPTPL